MQSICVTLTPLSAFATPLKGDTLFGQLCWAIRNRLGEAYLNQCLEGYTQQSTVCRRFRCFSRRLFAPAEIAELTFTNYRKAKIAKR